MLYLYLNYFSVNVQIVMSKYLHPYKFEIDESHKLLPHIFFSLTYHIFFSSLFKFHIFFYYYYYPLHHLFSQNVFPTIPHIPFIMSVNSLCGAYREEKSSCWNSIALWADVLHSWWSNIRVISERKRTQMLQLYTAQFRYIFCFQSLHMNRH